MKAQNKILAEKVISVFKLSKKNKLFFKNDLEHIFSDDEVRDSVMDSLVEMGFIEKLSPGYFRITNLGCDFESFSHLESKEETELIKAELEFKLKKWQVKTFWWIFSIAVAGSGMSIYNFLDNKLSVKKEKVLEQKLKEIKADIEELKPLKIKSQITDTINQQ